MKPKTIYFIGALVLFLLMAQVIVPQSSGGPYAITQSVVANGGGVSSDAVNNKFSITGTSGQHSAGGPFSNLPFNLFSGFWTSAVPTITAAAPLSRQQGSAAINGQIATVSDADQTVNTLIVTATPLTGSGVTINNISVDVAGIVTANVAASCSATNSTFTL